MTRKAVIVSTARTPIGKAYRGAFNDTPAQALGGHVISEAVKRAGVEPGEVEDVIMGAALQQGVGQGQQPGVPAQHPVAEVLAQRPVTRCQLGQGAGQGFRQGTALLQGLHQRAGGSGPGRHWRASVTETRSAAPTGVCTSQRIFDTNIELLPIRKRFGERSGPASPAAGRAAADGR